MDGRCETCRWWVPVDFVILANGNDEQVGVCLLMSASAKPGQAKRADAGCAKAGISGELYSAPDFGCVHWEARVDP